VFAGFSADALRDRINNAKAKVLLTANEGMRGGRAVFLKRTADEAVAFCPTIEVCFISIIIGSFLKLQKFINLARS